MRTLARTCTLALAAWAATWTAAAAPAQPGAAVAREGERPHAGLPLVGPGAERFALYAPARGHEEGAPEVLALVEWRRQRLPQGLQLQREVCFAEGGTEVGRVVHVERLTERDARLVWREIGSATGRSLCVEWTRDARGLAAFEWGRDGSRRITLEAFEGVVLPLYLVELARRGSATQGSYVTFDPLGRQLERLELRTSYSLARAGVAGTSGAGTSGAGTPAGGAWGEDAPREPAEAGSALELPPAGGARTVELRRRDGTLAGRYVFRGTDLVAFQLQEGGPVARRVSAGTYARLRTGLREAEPAR